MDVNGLPIEGFESVNLTAGLGAAPPLSASMQVPVVVPAVEELKETRGLTEAEKEHIILECKDAPTMRKAHKIIGQKVSDDERSKFLDGVRDSIF